MDYKLNENELLIHTKISEGGSLNMGSQKLIDKESIIAIHNSSIWIEIPGVVGMSFDKDIILAIMNKVSKINNNIVNNRKFEDFLAKSVKENILKDILEIFENISKDEYSKTSLKSSSRFNIHIELINRGIEVLDSILDKKGKYYSMVVLKNAGSEIGVNENRNEIHKEIINLINLFELNRYYEFSEKENGSKKITFIKK